MHRTDIQKSDRQSKSLHAILGLLSIRPMSGYDIRQLVTEALSHFWRESYGSIYPTLRRLADQGLVERRVEPGRAAADRYVYSLTEEGARVVDAWLAEPLASEPPIRSELLLKVFLGARAGMDRVQELLERFCQQQADVLERLQGAESLIAADSDAEEAFYWLLTVRRGVTVARARLEWAEKAIAAIRARRQRRRATVCPSTRESEEESS